MQKDFLVSEFKSNNLFTSLPYAFSSIKAAKEQVETFNQEMKKNVKNILAKPKEDFAWRDYQRLTQVEQGLVWVMTNLDLVQEFKKKEIYKELSASVLDVLWFDIYTSRRVKARLIALKNKTTNPTQKNILNIWLSDIMECPATSKNPKIEQIQQKITNVAGQLVHNIDNAMKDPKDCFAVHKKDIAKLKGISFSLLKQGYKMALSLGLSDMVVYPPDNYHSRLLLKELKISNVRREVYQKYIGANTKRKEYNNTKLLSELIKNKQRLAHLKNKENYCELVAENYFIKDRSDIEYFLKSSISQLKPLYDAQMVEIENLAKADGIKKPQIWDIGFFKEKLLNLKFEKIINKYTLTLPHVLEEMKKLFEEKFNVCIEWVENAELKKITANKVQAWKIIDKTSQKEGYILFDLYKDIHRKGNSFYTCSSIRPHFEHKNKSSASISWIRGTFADDRRSQLKPSILVSLIHELGHAFHNFYAQHTDPTHSNLKNYSWDLIELPSQFMEQFLYEPEIFARFLKPRRPKHKEDIVSDAASWIESYLFFFKFFDFYENLNIDLQRFELFTNYKPYSKKVVSEVLAPELKNQFYFNFNADYFLTDENYKTDYGPSKYVYLINDIMAYSVYQQTHKNQRIDLEEIYRYKFNHVSHQQLQENLRQDISFSTMDIRDYLCHGQNLTFLNTALTPQ